GEGGGDGGVAGDRGCGGRDGAGVLDEGAEGGGAGVVAEVGVDLGADGEGGVQGSGAGGEVEDERCAIGCTAPEPRALDTEAVLLLDAAAEDEPAVGDRGYGEDLFLRDVPAEGGAGLGAEVGGEAVEIA